MILLRKIKPFSNYGSSSDYLGHRNSTDNSYSFLSTNSPFLSVDVSDAQKFRIGNAKEHSVHCCTTTTD